MALLIGLTTLPPLTDWTAVRVLRASLSSCQHTQCCSTLIISVDELPIRANLSGMATSTRRAALYLRVSTSDRGQTVENQLQPLQEAAGRLGWTVVAIYRDEGISGSRGRHKRPDWMRCSRASPGASST